MDSPKVSIIVPVYNVERYLAQCLESLAGQTFTDIEVLCLDDGSTDASPRILDEFAEGDSRFRVYHRENSGVAHTRNLGIELARGEYILFVDSDDYIAQQTVDVLLRLAERERADIVVFGGKTFPTLSWADDSFVRRNKVYHSGVDALLYERGSIPLMCNKLYSASFLRKNQLRFNEKLTLGEDHAFQFVAFPLAKTVAFTGEMLYFYRVRPDSAVGASRDDGARQLLLHFDVVKYALNTWKDRGEFFEFTREAVSWAVSFLYNSAKLTYYNDRVRFAEVFNPFLKGLLDGRDESELKLTSNVEKQLHYLMSPQVDESSPEFTILLECADESDEAKEALDAIEFQDEQSFEILLFPPVDSESAYASSITDFIAHDRRARVIPKRDLQMTLSEARGKYFIRAYSNMVYDPASFDQLLQLAGEKKGDTVRNARKPFEIAVFSDSADMLGVCDLYDFYLPNPKEDVLPEGAHPAGDFGENLLSFSSIATGNKVFSRQFLVKCEERIPCTTWVALECVALSMANEIVATRRPLVTLLCLSFSSQRVNAAKAMLGGVFDGLAETSRLFSHDPVVLKGIDIAATRYFLLMTDLVRDPIARRYCIDDIKDRGETCIKRAIASGQLSSDEYKSANSLLQNSYDEYTGRRDSTVLNSIIMKNEKNLLAVGGQAAHIAQLDSDIEEFYQSISYRTGRAVTALPRAVMGFARRALHASSRK